MPQITLLPNNRILQAEAGENLRVILARAGLIDAPCGGQGTCGKCRVTIDGRQVLACRTTVDGELTLTLPQAPSPQITPLPGRRVAFDIGTTSLVCCLLDAGGRILNQATCQNPQASFGADVISRLWAARAGEGAVLTVLIRRAMTDLLLRLCSTPAEIEIISVVGNPAMQQLFLGLPVENLAQVPFVPVLCKSEFLDAAPIFPLCPQARLLTVPDISGFVGADTVAGILACGLHEAEEMTLLVDIGTNGELVLGSKNRLIACSTAAGPALEGANIHFGMRAEPGAIDHVWLEKGELRYSVIGGGTAKGICGSGLLDAVAAAQSLGLLNRRGRLLDDRNIIMLTDEIYLTQEDIRQVQLAKGAIRAGIGQMAEKIGIPVEDIQRVVLAGAFGSYLNPDSACRIGLLPEALRPKITAAGNTAARGACLLAADPDTLAITDAIVQKVEFLELGSLPAFPKAFAKAMELPENWCRSALALGFSEVKSFDPGILQAEAQVRAMCRADKCRAYGKNWTCPPHCGSLEQCQTKMHSYRHGILLQTVGQLSKVIDSRGYQIAEQRHLESFAALCTAIRRQYPQALCLGAGGCRICQTCAYPESCRFPEKAVSGMEGYGLFVTRVCREVGLSYYHGEKTITYTACINGPHCYRGFRVEENAIGVPVLPVAEGRCDHQPFLLFLAIAVADLIADVLGIVIVHESLHADDQVILIPESIQMLCHRQHSNTQLPQVVDEQGGLDSMPPQSGQVFYQHSLGQASLRCLCHLCQPVAVKTHPADIVIEGFAHDFVGIPFCIIPQDAKLIFQTVHLYIVIIGQPAVEPYLHAITLPFPEWKQRADHLHMYPYDPGKVL